jgi:hypothetical protein
LGFSDTSRKPNGFAANFESSKTVPLYVRVATGKFAAK